MSEISWGYTMAPLHEIFPFADARCDKSLDQIGGHLLPGAWWLSIKRDETAFGRDDNLFAREVSAREEVCESRTDASLASLKAIIDRTVENIATKFDRALDRRAIGLIS